MPPIRRIAVHVDEPAPGQFYWVLMEKSDAARRWDKLVSAEEPCSLWLDALEAGVRALTGYAPDERVGPRETAEDEDADPVG